jgi:hypothetical protein
VDIFSRRTDLKPLFIKHLGRAPGREFGPQSKGNDSERSWGRLDLKRPSPAAEAKYDDYRSYHRDCQSDYGN